MQLGGGAGVAAVVVALATFPLLGSSPDSSASAAQIGAYVSQHQNQLTAVGVMVTVSAVLYGWFAATYGWLLHSSARDTPLGFLSGVTGAVIAGLLVWDGILDVAMAFLSHQPSAAQAATMTGLYQLENGIVMPGAVGLVAAAFLGTAAAAAFRAVAGARRLGYLWAVLAVLSAAGGLIALSTVNGGMSSPLSFAPLLAVSLAAVVLGVGMMRHGRSAEVGEDGRQLQGAPATS